MPSGLVKDRPPAIHPLTCAILLLFMGSCPLIFKHILFLLPLRKRGGGNPQDSSLFQLYPNSSVPLQAISQNSCLHSVMLFLPFLSNPFQSGCCSHHYINLFCQDHSAFLIVNPRLGFQSLSDLTCLQHVTQWITSSALKQFLHVAPTTRLVVFLLPQLATPYQSAWLVASHLLNL